MNGTREFYASEMSIVCDSSKEAEIICKSCEVDAELKPALIRRTMKYADKTIYM